MSAVLHFREMERRSKYLARILLGCPGRILVERCYCIRETLPVAMRLYAWRDLTGLFGNNGASSEGRLAFPVEEKKKKKKRRNEERKT